MSDHQGILPCVVIGAGISGLVAATAMREQGVPIVVLDKGRVIGDDMPLLPTVSELFRSEETPHQTLFSVVEGEDKVHALVKAARSRVRDFENDDTGILSAVPVSHVFGNV